MRRKNIWSQRNFIFSRVEKNLQKKKKREKHEEIIKKTCTFRPRLNGYNGQIQNHTEICTLFTRKTNSEPYRICKGSNCLRGRWIVRTVPKFARFLLPTCTEEEFRTVPKFARFCLFTRKTNSEPCLNLHGSSCLHGRRIWNWIKICKVPPVYTKDEFGTVYQHFRSCENFGTVPNPSDIMCKRGLI